MSNYYYLNGTKLNLSQIARDPQVNTNGLAYTTIYNRLLHGWTIYEALEPLNQRYKKRTRAVTSTVAPKAASVQDYLRLDERRAAFLRMRKEAK